MTPELIVVVIVALVIIGIVLYLHTSAGKALEAKGKAELDALHTKLDSLGQTLHLVHAATIAPVSVVGVPSAQPAQAISSTPAPAQPATTITIAGPHVNSMIENMLGRTAQTDAILDQRVADAAKLPPAGTTNRWDTTFPWTSAGGDPLYFNQDTTFNVPVPNGYQGQVTIDFGETPAAGPVPAKLSLNGQLFEGPNVRTASVTVPAIASFNFKAVPMDEAGNPVTGQGGSLVLHHQP